MLAAIAAISRLLVGGIGIMNIMLASDAADPRDRDTEGGRGDAPGDSRQFLIEAVVMSGVGGVIGILAGILFGFAIARFAGWKMVFSLQAIVIAVTVSAAVGVFFDCILRVAPRRSIRSRHCGMNEPIGSVQPVVLLKSLSKSYRLGGRRFRAGSDRCADRCG